MILAKDKARSLEYGCDEKVTIIECNVSDRRFEDFIVLFDTGRGFFFYSSTGDGLGVIGCMWAAVPDGAARRLFQGWRAERPGPWAELPWQSHGSSISSASVRGAKPGQDRMSGS